jgi:outer membrane biogenesis lipoprotein LolB
MKPTRRFSRITFSLLALASTLLFAGCATTESGSDTRNSDSSGHQHHH